MWYLINSQSKKKKHSIEFGKYLDSGKDRRQEKGMTEDKVVRWHHQLSGHEFEQAPGGGAGRGSMACCSLWGHRGGHN